MQKLKCPHKIEIVNVFVSSWQKGVTERNRFILVFTEKNYCSVSGVFRFIDTLSLLYTMESLHFWHRENVEKVFRPKSAHWFELIILQWYFILYALPCVEIFQKVMKSLNLVFYFLFDIIVCVLSLKNKKAKDLSWLFAW